MARRYGGTHSPGGAEVEAPDLRPPLRGRARTSILSALGGLSVAAAFFQGGAVDLVTQMLGGAGLLAAGVVTREGLKAQAAYEARKVARRPAAPRKTIGAALTGAGVASASLAGLDGLLPALVYGATAAGLHVAAFGLDPMRDKGFGADDVQSGRVVRAVEAAEAALDEMAAAVRRSRDRAAEAAVDDLRATAAAMVRVVEADPRDLLAARKYLGVYLSAARDAAVKYADLSPQARGPVERERFVSLIRDLREGMEAKRETLLIADRADLEIEVETLRDRLRREGVHVASTNEGE